MKMTADMSKEASYRAAKKLRVFEKVAFGRIRTSRILTNILFLHRPFDGSLTSLAVAAIHSQLQ